MKKLRNADAQIPNLASTNTWAKTDLHFQGGSRCTRTTLRPMSASEFVTFKDNHMPRQSWAILPTMTEDQWNQTTNRYKHSSNGFLDLQVPQTKPRKKEHTRAAVHDINGILLCLKRFERNRQSPLTPLLSLIVQVTKPPPQCQCPGGDAENPLVRRALRCGTWFYHVLSMWESAKTYAHKSGLHMLVSLLVVHCIALQCFGCLCHFVCRLSFESQQVSYTWVLVERETRKERKKKKRESMCSIDATVFPSSFLSSTSQASSTIALYEDRSWSSLGIA